MHEITPSMITIALGATLLIAYYAKLTVNRFRVPDVTGYVILGVAAGALVFKHLPGLLDSMDIVANLALGIIAFIVGHELKKESLAKLGKPIFMIATMEAFMAFAAVFCGLYFTHLAPLHTALILGSIASATAPAATVFVIHQYRSQGDLTSTILAVVGIDDAIALIIYVFASAIAKCSFTGTHLSLAIMWKPVVDVSLSLIIGVVGAGLFTSIFRNVRNKELMTMGFAAFITLLLGIAEYFSLSELLAIMTFSAVVTNLSPSLSRRSNDVIQDLTPVFLPLFFIFAGAHLDLSMVSSIAVIGLAYTFLRASGKITGASLGATLGKAPPAVKKYVGLGLIPQIGVAIALALAVRREFGDAAGPFGTDGATMATLIINVLLCSTVVTEIAGPMLTKYAIFKVGEAQQS